MEKLALFLLIEHILRLERKVDKLMSELDDAIATLKADNTALKAKLDALPAGIATQIAAAIAAQANNGVSAENLQDLADLHTALGGEATQLDAALQGTPPATDPGTVPAQGTDAGSLPPAQPIS